MRLVIWVFDGETKEEAAAWYFAQRPEHAGSRNIEFRRHDGPRDGGLNEQLAALQQHEFDALLARINDTSRHLPVKAEKAA